MAEVAEFTIIRASQLTTPNKDWTHYRLGLKLRCTKSTLGLTLAILSQGRTIDTTFVTGANVKFLIKTPIVGIKSFDGDKLKKRLQITFESEGGFNLFANKTRQWLGINMIVASLSESTPSNSQFAPPVESSQMPIVVEEPINTTEQNASQAMSFATQLSISNIFQLQARTEQVSYASNAAPLSQLADAIEIKEDDWTQYTQQDTLMSTAKLGYHDSLQTSIFLKDNSKLKAVIQDTVFPNGPEINENCIKETLEDNSFVPKEKERKRRRNNRKELSADRFELAIAKAIQEVVHNKDESLLDLNDQQLALQMARVLKSQNFVRLVTRVESLLHAVSDKDA